MKKSNLIRIPVNDMQVRYRLFYESEPCDPASVMGRNEQFTLLQQLAGDPQLCYCGNQLFDTMKVFHSGTCWVVELEALETMA